MTKTILAITLTTLLFGCPSSEEGLTSRDAIEEVMIVFCDRVTECGNAPGGQSCVDYNMENICPEGYCSADISDKQGTLDTCLSELTDMQCSAPLGFPAACDETLDTNQ